MPTTHKADVEWIGGFIDGEGRLVSTTTSVRKFWERMARVSSRSSTNLKAPGVSTFDPSS